MSGRRRKQRIRPERLARQEHRPIKMYLLGPSDREGRVVKNGDKVPNPSVSDCETRFGPRERGAAGFWVGHQRPRRGERSFFGGVAGAAAEGEPLQRHRWPGEAARRRSGRGKASGLSRAGAAGAGLRATPPVVRRPRPIAGRFCERGARAALPYGRTGSATAWVGRLAVRAAAPAV